MRELDNATSDKHLLLITSKRLLFTRVFALFILGMVIGQTLSGQTCTRNVIDCKGICGKFTNNDSDSICDLSPRSTPKLSGTEDVKKSEGIPANDTLRNKHNQSATYKTQSEDSDLSNHKKPESAYNSEITDSDSSETALSVANIEKPEAQQPDNAPAKATENPRLTKKEKAKPYPLITICLATLLLYAGSVALVKLGKIKKVTHRKLWNMLLLISFLMSGILGLLLVFQMNYDFWMKGFGTFLTLHVDFGIAMAIISIFHVCWHLSYFKNLFISRKRGY